MVVVADVNAAAEQAVVADDDFLETADVKAVRRGNPLPDNDGGLKQGAPNTINGLKPRIAVDVGTRTHRNVPGTNHPPAGAEVAAGPTQGRSMEPPEYLFHNEPQLAEQDLLPKNLNQPIHKSRCINAN